MAGSPASGRVRARRPARAAAASWARAELMVVSRSAASASAVTAPTSDIQNRSDACVGDGAGVERDICLLLPVRCRGGREKTAPRVGLANRPAARDDRGDGATQRGAGENMRATRALLGA